MSQTQTQKNDSITIFQYVSGWPYLTFDHDHYDTCIVTQETKDPKFTEKRKVTEYFNGVRTRHQISTFKTMIPLFIALISDYIPHGGMVCAAACAIWMMDTFYHYPRSKVVTLIPNKVKTNVERTDVKN